MSRLFILSHAQARQRAAAACMESPEGYVVQIKEATRTSDQNARLWASLGDLAEQVEWYGRKLSPEDWKHVFSASLRKMEVVPNLDGTGFVALGQSTSKMGKREFSDLLELIYSFGAERGVVFHDEATA